MQVNPPQSSMRQSKPPERLSYMALMTELINFEPSSFEEAAQHDVWQEAMVEEYDLIMKNQVWEVVPRPEDKKVMGSRWIYKVKHATSRALWLRGFHRRKVLTMRRPSPMMPDILLFELLSH